MNNLEKVYTNADLQQSKHDFFQSVTNDFIDDDFIAKLEWGMLLCQSRFKQMKTGAYKLEESLNSYDKAILLSDDLNKGMKVLSPIESQQVTPEIFPFINIKSYNVGETIGLHKVQELRAEFKRGLWYTKKYVYKVSGSFYKKDTESWYSNIDGYQINPGFFGIVNQFLSLNELSFDENGESDEVRNQMKKLAPYFQPISLKGAYRIKDNSLTYISPLIIWDVIKRISMFYQLALTMYYEWSMYIKEYDNIGFVIPIDPAILKELFTNSMAKFETRKNMLHFVRDHYRRKPKTNEDNYSVYVNKYLRGETKFDYRGFYAEIIPPKYDLNRVKTKKTFKDIIN